MTSSFKDKEGNLKSRIYPTFSGGDIVTDPRSQGFYLVTEYGIANLAGRTTWEKAEMLIGLANPIHRDLLIQRFTPTQADSLQRLLLSAL